MSSHISSPANPLTRPHAALLLSCLLLGGCARDSGPITIGAAGPLGWSVGAGMKQGVELAVAEINANGGVRGRRLEVLMRDDGGDGSRAVAVAEEFARNREVVGVVGHVTSGAMVAAAKVYDGQLAAISTSATSPEITGISPWVFRVISSDSLNGHELARFAGRMGRKRAAIIYENDSYGRGLANAFRQAFAGEIVSMDPISADLADAEPYITHYKRREPDVVFVAGMEGSGLAILREARRQRLTADFVGGDGWSGIVADTALAEGAYVGVPFTPEDPRQEVQSFVSAFRKKFGTRPDDNAALGYDATRVLARAIERAGASRAAVRKQLALAGDSAAYRGVTGVITFGPNGDPEGKAIAMARVRSGAFIPAAKQ